MTPRLYPEGREQVNIVVRAVKIRRKEHPRIWEEEEESFVKLDEDEEDMANQGLVFKILRILIENIL